MKLSEPAHPGPASQPNAAEDAALAMLESAARREKQQQVEPPAVKILRWLRRLIK